MLKELETKNWKIVLIVCAHPDDEVVMGGTIARLVHEGKKVILVVATNGEMGQNANEPCLSCSMKLAWARKKEQLAAARILGASEVIFLNFPDQGLRLNKRKVEEKLESIFRRFRPQAVFTWALSPREFPHQDHVAINQITVQALARVTTNPHQPELYFFLPTYGLATHFMPTDRFAKRKLPALKAHFSQLTPVLLKKLSRLIEEGERKFTQPTEVFVKKNYSSAVSGSTSQ